MEAISVISIIFLLNVQLLGTIIGVPLAEELGGVEAIIVTILKFIMLGVMVGGAVAVFREIIPMARGRARTSTAPVESEGETQ